MLDDALRLADLAGVPGNRQWRICFRWEEDGAYDVEITDYH